MIEEMRDGDLDAVVELWTSCGLTRPWNDSTRDIAFARAGTNSTVLVLREGGGLAGTVMVGHDGHRGAVYYLAVDPALQRRGHGLRLMRAAEAWLRERGVWKLNLMVRAENAQVRGFYVDAGYAEEERIVFSRAIGETAP